MRLAVGAAVLFAIQVVVGGLQVLTRLSAWTQTLHLALGAVIFAMLVGPDRHELLRGAHGAAPAASDEARHGSHSGSRARPATASAPTSR